jgi:hypothetical protein
MKTEHRLEYSYDDVGDVLYVSIRIPPRTKNEETEPGLVLRYDLETHEPVAATIIDYKEYWWSRRDVLASELAKFFGIPQPETARMLESV